MRELAPGDLIAGKFRLECVVGRGGMGSVWAARNEQLGMLVALKFIEAGDDVGGADLADATARFEREARAAAQIRSPHVAQILDHGIDGDRPFIAMELLEGEDLGQRLRREGRISVAATATILTQAAKALRRAHEAGIIHRDLKPGNVFLARFDDDEVVKILDFGVAKVITEGAIQGPAATQVGMVFGSPSYMSPEQARGVRPLDHRTDLWSLAVIAFRAVTGVKPFEGSTIADLVVKLCIDPLPVATSFAPDLPLEIDRFFERAFARDINARFSSAVELAAALERIASGAATAPAFVAAPTASQPAPMLPVAGSGPHVAFAPGTLTPPPGSAPSAEEDGRTQALPSPNDGMPQHAPPVAPVVKSAPGSTRIDMTRSPPRGHPAIVIGAAVGVASLALLAIGLLVVSRGDRDHADPVAPAAPMANSAIEPVVAADPPPPPPDPAPAPAPTASASADPAQPAASASAEPSAAPVPKPKGSTKGGKRRPNFGY